MNGRARLKYCSILFVDFRIGPTAWEDKFKFITFRIQTRCCRATSVANKANESEIGKETLKK